MDEPLRIDDAIHRQLLSIQSKNASTNATVTASLPRGRTEEPLPGDGLDDVNAELATTADEESAPPSFSFDRGRAAMNEKPPHYWTWRVVAAGLAADETCLVRQFGRAKLIEHLLAAVHDGLAVDLNLVFSPDQLDELRRISASANGPLRTRNQLPAGISPAEVDLYSALQNYSALQRPANGAATVGGTRPPAIR
jgi:hypothetical protein